MSIFLQYQMEKVWLKDRISKEIISFHLFPVVEMLDPDWMWEHKQDLKYLKCRSAFPWFQIHTEFSL